jgi:uncharacterized membrane protein
MSGTFTRLPAAIALFGAVLGLVFSTYSTVDYAAHLDRRLHDVHCSVIPGAPPQAEAEGCRAAMYSPYGSVLKDQFWGGLPVALPAQGSFAFFLGFALYLLVAGPRASKAATIFFAVVGATPLLVSVVMFLIAVTQLGTICQTCLGIYIASFLVAAGAIVGLLGLRQRSPTDPERQRGNLLLPVVWLAVLGGLTLMPAAVYAASVPDERPYLTGCGKLAKPEAKPGVLVHIAGPRAVRPAIIFEDPLCATCKGVHQRLVGEGILDRLNVDLVLFPLDNECNWMLDQALHPGACLVARAVLCAGDQAPQVLNWAYAEQEYLLKAGKAGGGSLREVIRRRWGDGVARCLDDKQTKLRLNEHLHFASNNSVPVSTPQIYLSNQRLCDEDTDLGLRYTLRQIAPEVLQ